MFQPEVQIGCDLIIARAGSVQFASNGADFSGQQGFHIKMDILIFNREVQFASSQFLLQMLQTRRDRVGIGLGDDAGFAQHLDMCKRPLQILLGHLLIKTDGGSKSINPVCRFFGKPTAP